MEEKDAVEEGGSVASWDAVEVFARQHLTRYGIIVWLLAGEAPEVSADAVGSFMGCHPSHAAGHLRALALMGALRVRRAPTEGRPRLLYSLHPEHLTNAPQPLKAK